MKTMRPALFVLSAAAVLVGCSSARPDLQSPGPASGELITYSVRCQECEVSYTTGGKIGTAQVKGLWHTSVRVDATMVRTVTLTATPARSGIVVDRATIEVNGRRVAEKRRVQTTGFNDAVTVSAMVGS